MGLRSFTALDFYLLFIVVLHLYPKFSSNIERKSSLTDESKLKYTCKIRYMMYSRTNLKFLLPSNDSKKQLWPNGQGFAIRVVRGSVTQRHLCEIVNVAPFTLHRVTSTICRKTASSTLSTELQSVIKLYVRRAFRRSGRISRLG